MDRKLPRKIYTILKDHPISPEKMQEAVELGMLTKDKLIEGKYYLGYCRNARAALWDGKRFWYMRRKFNFVFKESIVHPEDDEHYDIFCPIEVIEPGEFEIIKKGYEIGR